MSECWDRRDDVRSVEICRRPVVLGQERCCEVSGDMSEAAPGGSGEVTRTLSPAAPQSDLTSPRWTSTHLSSAWLSSASSLQPGGSSLDRRNCVLTVIFQREVS